MSTLRTMPAVASRVYFECKKCKVERYQIVLAQTGESSVKLECEVCHAKKSVKIGEAKSRRLSGAAKTAKAVPRTQWSEVEGRIQETKKVRYDMRQSFSKETTIDHPKFGLGLVIEAGPNAIEVVFADGTRSLVHNRV